MKYSSKSKGKRWYQYLVVCIVLTLLCGIVGCGKKEEVEKCESTGCEEAVYKDDLCENHYGEKKNTEQKEDKVTTTVTSEPTATSESMETSTQNEEFSKFDDVMVGDTVTFGTYEQDNDKNNGVEDIEWYVLDRKGDDVLLFSKYCLDSMLYHEKDESVTWETCTLRDWLNDEFYDNAFSSKEQSYIKLSSLTNEDDSISGTEGGEDTKDKVFLLSLNELKQYFSLTEEGYFFYCYDSCFLTEVTEYAKTKVDTTKCGWWLRSPGMFEGSFVIVQNKPNSDSDSFGAVDLLGDYNFSDGYYVRPALWLDLNP